MFYTYKCLKEVEKIFKTRRPSADTRGINLMHDNASCFKLRLECNRGIRIHITWSSSLLSRSCSLWFLVFSRSLKVLGGRHFSSRSDLGAGSYQYMKSIDRYLYKNIFSVDQKAETLRRTWWRVLRLFNVIVCIYIFQLDIIDQGRYSCVDTI